VHILNKFVEVISTLILVTIVFLVILQILTRLVYPIAWTWEIATILNTYLVFIGVYVVTSRNEHVKVDYFSLQLPKWCQIYVDLFVNVITFLSLSIMILAGYNTIINISGLRTPAARIPISVLIAAMTIGSVLMLIYTAFESFKTICLIIAARQGRKGE